jgi:hypothetical protein
VKDIGGIIMLVILSAKVSAFPIVVIVEEGDEWIQQERNLE